MQSLNWHFKKLRSEFASLQVFKTGPLYWYLPARSTARVRPHLIPNSKIKLPEPEVVHDLGPLALVVLHPEP